MTRTYTLKRRAEQQAQTRLRIVEAAVDLHASVGPAATTFSMVAEAAGVQRHTLYAHFPNERSLYLACSALALERDPMPDAEPWRGLGEGAARLAAGLEALYGWYERNAALAACVLRDAEHHPVIREVVELRHGPSFGAYHEVLGAGLAEPQRAMLALALSFFTWRTLVREAGSTSSVAAAAMAHAVIGAAQAVQR